MREDDLVNILRVAYKREEKAARLNIAKTGDSISFNPKEGFFDFYGGRAKFTIRFDPQSQRYWSLVSKMTQPEAYRNRLVLVSSESLRKWEVESVLLEHPDSEHHAFQYVHWLFDGSNIIAVSRTAWDDSHNAHDAIHMTFHRFENFRQSEQR